MTKRNKLYWSVFTWKSKIFTLFIVTEIIISCNKKEETDPFNYRQEMRNFVMEISQFSRSSNPGFIIIPQNGVELISNSKENINDINQDYLSAISGQGQEDLYYGYYFDDVATPEEETNYLNNYLSKFRNSGKTVLITDYCYSLPKVADSYNQNSSNNYIPFVSMKRELDEIPFFPVEPFRVNDEVIKELSQIQNFLYLINYQQYPTKQEVIRSFSQTNYDLLIMDLFFNDGKPFSPAELASLKIKPNGARRLVVCYLSIGEAEDYRYYWQPEWDSVAPDWLGDPDPHWTGNYYVKYWLPEWQSIISGNDSSYVKQAIDAGFDGLYLDIIDAFEQYE